MTEDDECQNSQIRKLWAFGRACHGTFPQGLLYSGHDQATVLFQPCDVIFPRPKRMRKGMIRAVGDLRQILGKKWFKSNLEELKLDLVESCGCKPDKIRTGQEKSVQKSVLLDVSKTRIRCSDAFPFEHHSTSKWIISSYSLFRVMFRNSNPQKKAPHFHPQPGTYQPRLSFPTPTGVHFPTQPWPLSAKPRLGKWQWYPAPGQIRQNTELG